MTAIAHPQLPRAELVSASTGRRAVLIAALFALAIALAVMSLASPGSPAPVRTAGAPPADPAARQAAPAVYVVGPGDTVWSIARSLQPEGDLRSTVDHLIALNGGAALEVGQRFRLR